MEIMAMRSSCIRIEFHGCRHRKTRSRETEGDSAATSKQIQNPWCPASPQTGDFLLNSLFSRLTINASPTCDAAIFLVAHHFTFSTGP